MPGAGFLSQRHGDGPGQRAGQRAMIGGNKPGHDGQKDDDESSKLGCEAGSHGILSLTEGPPVQTLFASPNIQR